MTFLKLLLSNSIIYLAVVATASPIDGEESKIMGNDEQTKIMRNSALNNKSSNILNYIIPIHYNIELMLLNNYLRSKCIITLDISYAKENISFYAPDSASLIVLTLRKNNNTIYETNSTNLIKNNIVLLDFGDILLRGMYDLYIEYEISLNIVRESFGIPYIDDNKEIEWLIGTGIPAKRQQIFPHWDKPELKITFNISIMHHPRYKALSNMPIRDIELTNDKMIWTYFNETPSISLDSVAFLVSSFHQSILPKNDTIRSSIWFRRQSEPHLEFAKTVISSTNVYIHGWNIWRRQLAGLPSVLFESKMDHVVIPDLQNEIEQTFGFIFYREVDITYNEELDSVAHKTIITRLVARGIVQKYIKSLFRPTYLWPHTWLNEGFNIFYQAYIIDKALPNSRMMDLFVVQVQHELLYLNTYVVINSTIEYNNHENYFHSSISHMKGSILWRMLIRTLPSDIFSTEFIKHLNNQLSEPEAATADHLWDALRSKMSELNPKYFNIKDAINSWIMERYPSVLKVKRNYSTNVVSVSVQFRDKLDKEQYYIPISYATESNPNFIITWTNISLTPWFSKTELYLEKNQWIIFNLQQAGYYRVNYDIVNWRKIAQYLNSQKYRNIHVLNRAQIINDAFHFAIEKELEFSVFWELASYLGQERDYIAWYPMLKAFEFLSNIFPFLNFYPEFKGVLKFDFMQKHKISNWNLLNQSHINDRTKCLKQELAKWKCIMNDHSCEESSKRHLKWHLANPKENKLLPGWKRWTYCNGLKTADHDTWDIVFHNYMKGNDKMFECLTYSKNSEILIHYLEIITHAVIISQISKSLYNQFHLQLESIERAYTLNANIFLSILERNTKYMLTNLLKNYKIIRHRRVNEIVTLIVIINNAYSKGQLGEISKFVKKELKNSVIPNIEYKIKTRSWEIEKQIYYFRSLFNN
ncbi:aminopeptidase N-like [Camponotus floridanus]|uniref:aminopeptidase N-like n=1 Tax=Camponotus floridanus TaxID=104421 RepID=UPI000DC68049|nr:aminopeptidase N-like [Camponotus floridanus]XP_025269980.1 aminopeptidase N-like [Camponotus floridanus]